MRRWKQMPRLCIDTGPVAPGSAVPEWEGTFAYQVFDETDPVVPVLIHQAGGFSSHQTADEAARIWIKLLAASLAYDIVEEAHDQPKKEEVFESKTDKH
jgi:hypothetical protein